MNDKINVKKQVIGVLTDGSVISAYTVSNGEVTFTALDYGCILASLLMPSKSGKVDDILLGFSTLTGFVERNGPHFGSLIGRYANRIRGASFTLDGKTYELQKNYDGKHMLHGGFTRYDKMVWQSEIAETPDGKGVRFTRLSPDGEQGFPGNLALEVLYLLNDNNELTFRYIGKTDAATPINLTNHAYFNLKGNDGGNVGRHVARIGSNKRFEIDEFSIPTGKILPVSGTAFDFTSEKPVGKDFGSPDLAQTNGGYDVCYCFDTPSSKPEFRAAVSEPETGRKVTVSSNQPCMQFYTSTNLKPTLGKNGFTYDKMGAFCLETQAYSNAPNTPEFPQAVLRPGETYESVSVYSFMVEG
jgi:aldose 1-epimerase